MGMRNLYGFEEQFPLPLPFMEPEDMPGVGVIGMP